MPARKIWSPAWPSTGGHAQWIEPRKHEGVTLQAADGVWRVAFAFDIRRRAVLFAAGDKSGVKEKRFYRELIRRADERFDAHLEELRKERK